MEAAAYLGVDKAIYRNAAVLTREHGEDVALEAASRADAMFAKGDLGGRRVRDRGLDQELLLS